MRGQRVWDRRSVRKENEESNKRQQGERWSEVRPKDLKCVNTAVRT